VVNTSCVGGPGDVTEKGLLVAGTTGLTGEFVLLPVAVMVYGAAFILPLLGLSVIAPANVHDDGAVHTPSFAAVMVPLQVEARSPPDAVRVIVPTHD
jgi:hypothetical protein